MNSVSSPLASHQQQDTARFNPAQREAIAHGNGPLLVLAGAGTGKTSVLTHRMLHLYHELGIPPQHMVAMTFTNKAALEMQNRLAQLSPALKPPHLLIGTFHRVCGQLLRQYAEHIDLTPQYIIYDSADQLRLLTQIMTENGYNIQTCSPKAVRSTIEKWHNAGLLPHDVRKDMAGQVVGNRFLMQALDVYVAYEKAKQNRNAVDFGSLILKTIQLLQTQPSIQAAIREQWQHVLVDEYQDTNPAQHRLLQCLTPPEGNIFAVGDDDQSIYRWRGADVRHIVYFEKHYPTAKVIRLEQNYRSTQIILHAANAIIQHNRVRKGKTLFTEQSPGEKIKLDFYPSELSEAAGICRYIQEHQQKNHVYDDMAILYRTNVQSRAFEEQLRKARVPYKIYGGMRFYERKEIKDLIAYLRIIQNPNSDIDTLRILEAFPRGIGAQTLARLQEHAQQQACSLLHAAKAFINTNAVKITPRGRQSLAQLCQSCEQWAAQIAANLPLPQLLQHILDESGYALYLQGLGPIEFQERSDNIKELKNVLNLLHEQHPEQHAQPLLQQFLTDVSLTMATDDNEQASPQGSVKMMTLHAAKGLEFPIVFLAGLEEGLFPHAQSLHEPEELEEERRLCYVGMTRSQKYLYLSAAHTRYQFGELKPSIPSRFLDEIPSEYLITPQKVAMKTSAARASSLRGGGHRKPTPTTGIVSSTPSALARPTSPFQVGQYVQHRLFGRGKVMHVSGPSADMRLKIQFAQHGEKTIIARFVQPL